MECIIDNIDKIRHFHTCAIRRENVSDMLYKCLRKDTCMCVHLEKMIAISYTISALMNYITNRIGLYSKIYKCTLRGIFYSLSVKERRGGPK